MAYVQVFGDKPVGGHWHMPRQHLERLASMKNHSSAFSDETFESALPLFKSDSWAETIANHIAPLRPTALMLACAWWDTPGARFFDHLRAAAANASTCVVFRASTQVGAWNRKDTAKGEAADRLARRAFSQDVIFEAAKVTAGLDTKRLWWDTGGIHFTAASGAYRALNQALLALVASRCPGPSFVAAPKPTRGWAAGW